MGARHEDQSRTLATSLKSRAKASSARVKQQESPVYGPFLVPISGWVSEKEIIILSGMQIFGITREESQDLAIRYAITISHFSLTDKEVAKGIKEIYIEVAFYEEVVHAKNGGLSKSKAEIGQRRATLGSRPLEEQKNFRERVDQEFEKRTGRKPPTSTASSNDQGLWELIQDDLLRTEETAAQAKLEALPPEIKELLQGPAWTKPEHREQLARIGGKLRQLTPQQLSLYGLLAKELSKDLDAFERSVDAYIQYTQAFTNQIEEAAKQASDEASLEEVSKQAWKGFDPKQLATRSEADKRWLARTIAWKQSQAQLKYMATHPGRTITGMARSLVRVDELAQSIANDIQAAADGDRNAFSRWASALGAGTKSLGWMAGVLGAVAALVYVGVLFIPGVNVVALATTALVLAAGAVILSLAEYEMRIRAAGQANTEALFRQEVDKAGEAGTNFIFGSLLLLSGVALRYIARTPLPGRMQNVGNVLKLAGEALGKTPRGAAFLKWRADMLFNLRQCQARLWEALGASKKMMIAEAKLLKRIKSGKELAALLASGDETLSRLTGISKEVGQQYQKLASMPEGLAALERLRQDLLRAVHEAPHIAEKQVHRMDGELKTLIKAIERAETAEKAQVALAEVEARLGEEAVSQQVLADQEFLLQELSKEANANLTKPPTKLVTASEVEISPLREAKAKQWLERLEGSLSPGAKTILKQLCEGMEAAEARALLQRMGGKEYLEGVATGKLLEISVRPKPGKPIRKGKEIEIDLTDDAGGIIGTFDPLTGDLYIEIVNVVDKYADLGLSVELYAELIKAAGEVKTISGKMAMDNAKVIKETGNPLETPRAKALSQLGYTEHTYDPITQILVSKKPQR